MKLVLKWSFLGQKDRAGAPWAIPLATPLWERISRSSLSKTCTACNYKTYIDRGSISNLMIWPRVLSSSEIHNIAHSFFVRNPQHRTQLHLPQRLLRCINTGQSGIGGKRRLCLCWNMPRCVTIMPTSLHNINIICKARSHYCVKVLQCI